MSDDFDIRRAVSEALIQQGYRRNRGTHKRVIEGPWSSIVEIGRISSRPSDLAPFVYMRHDEVQRLSSQFMELEDDPYVATVGANPGYILGDQKSYRWWSWDSGPTAVQEALQEIAEARAFLERWASLEMLPDLYRQRWAMDSIAHYRLAVIFGLLGDHSGVKEMLERGRGIDCREENSLCEQFRRFERNLLTWLETGDSRGGQSR